MAKILQLTLMTFVVAALGVITGCETGPVEGAAGSDVGVARHQIVAGFAGNPEFSVSSSFNGARQSETYQHESGLFELNLTGSSLALVEVSMVVHTLDNGAGVGTASVDPEVLTTLPRRFIRNMFKNTDRVYDIYSEVAFGPLNVERRIIFENKDMLFTKDAAGVVTLSVKRSRFTN